MEMTQGNLLRTLMVKQRLDVQDALDFVHDVVIDGQDAIDNLWTGWRTLLGLTSSN